MGSKSAIFLDRDGVLNKKMPEGDYVKSWDEFKFLPGVIKALNYLKEGNYLTILITNQRGIAKGLYSTERLNEIHVKMKKIISENNGNIDAIYFCPHDEKDNCDCRKPQPGMIYSAIEDFKKMGIEIDVNTSYMIGDSEKDILAGNIVGLRTIKIGDKHSQAFACVRDLAEAVDLITNSQRG